MATIAGPRSSGVKSFPNFASLPSEGRTGVVYVAEDTDKTYVWDDTARAYKTTSGTELTANQVAALNGSVSPSVSNPFATRTYAMGLARDEVDVRVPGMINTAINAAVPASTRSALAAAESPSGSNQFMTRSAADTLAQNAANNALLAALPEGVRNALNAADSPNVANPFMTQSAVEKVMFPDTYKFVMGGNSGSVFVSSSTNYVRYKTTSNPSWQVGSWAMYFNAYEEVIIQPCDGNGNYAGTITSIEAAANGMPAGPSSIQQLPPSLTTLNLSNCIFLTTIPELPTTLVDLYADSSAITSLPALPQSLVNLRTASCNSLTSLTPVGVQLPNGIQTIVATNCGSLTSLPNYLPAGLRTLTVDGTPLSALPSILPSGLVSLSAKTCPLTYLPGNLEYLLDLDYLYLTSCTFLTTFPSLPSGILILDMGYCTGLQVPAAYQIPANVGELIFTGCNFDTLPSLAGLTNLSALSIAYCTYLQSIPSLPASLTSLYASGCTGLFSATSLASHPALQSINFSWCSNLYMMASPLPQTLSAFDISSCGFGDSALNGIFNDLAAVPTNGSCWAAYNPGSATANPTPAVNAGWSVYLN